MRVAHLIILVTALNATWMAEAAEKEPHSERKDAAESIGEGNAARWLEYYRRERGDSWQGKPEHDDKQTPSDPSVPAAQPTPSR